MGFLLLFWNGGGGIEQGFVHLTASRTAETHTPARQTETMTAARQTGALSGARLL